MWTKVKKDDSDWKSLTMNRTGKLVIRKKHSGLHVSVGNLHRLFCKNKELALFYCLHGYSQSLFVVSDI